MALKSIEKLRNALKDCTNKAGVEPNEFDTYWITASACDILIDDVEAEIAERYMLLPVDADDEPIRVGDVMYHKSDSSMEVVVEGVCGNSFMIGKWGKYTRCLEADKEWYHVKPRTLEDVLRDVWKEALDYAKSDIWRNPDEVFAERADEIRELLRGDA